MNREFLSWQEIQIQSLLTASTKAELTDILVQAGQELGFESIAFGMREPLPLSNPKTVMVNNYSEAWQARYVQQNYLQIDPTVAHGMRSVMPLVWSDESFKDARPFWEDAQEHGLKVGWAQSTIDAQGRVGMLTLSRSTTALSGAELRDHSMQMRWITQMALEGMAKLHQTTQRSPLPQIQLTAREIEVLRWTADGKTSGEVGQIINISERTVNFHINNSLEKLGANNKTAGVIKAALMRLL
jgi:LuxR family quorum-sensing system transcriptional regulator SolR